jgi:hypothetical protein
MDDLQPRGDMVVDGRKRDAQRSLQPDLLLHLTDSALRYCLADVELSLRPGPVVILGPVDQEDFQLVLLDTPRQGAGRSDGNGLARMVSLVGYR